MMKEMVPLVSIVAVSVVMVGCAREMQSLGNSEAGAAPVVTTEFNLDA